ncbi:MAG: hypothetical protein IAC55_01630 [Tyzzerella sp.]|uniref:HTH-type transcriptional regulator SarZ n=1 Tax=Candidatus Fimicola merdigallinarum TaxID=2840819 RepID=A0A9D9DWE6_9FIRM|nr:hypothetical protein [Candidatus Fimicola merdigallinarum]
MCDEYNILKALKRIHIEIENVINHSISKYDLTAAQGDILGYLIRHKDEKICSTDIHIKMGISRASVSATLKKLRNNNFIVFTNVNHDERVKYIELTDKALMIEKEIRSCFEKINTIIYNDFSENEKAQLTGYMKKMTKNIKNFKQFE